MKEIYRVQQTGVESKKDIPNCVTSLQDLRPFGFNCLTGEACGIGLRLLFDVNEKGKEILCSFLGVSDITLLPDWNGGDAIGSVMLARDAAFELAVWCMIGEYQEVWHNRSCGEIHGLEPDQIELAHATWGHDKDGHDWRIYRREGTAAGGLRNRHEMTGRVA
jgi:hypothetical protein